MNSIISFIKRWSIAICLIITSQSCEKFQDREPNDFSSVGFYQSEAAVKAGVSGIYNALYINLASRLPFNVMLDHWTSLAMERAENTTIGAGGGLNPDNALVKQWWTALYVIIARANSVITGAEPYLDMLGGKSQQYLAEARLLRSYAYYQLISTFGDVPFYSEPVTTDQYLDAKVPKKEILDFILSEMDSLAGALPWMATERGRVDRAVAFGLKARAALLGGSLDYGGNGEVYFKMAAEAAQAVIGQRTLAPSFDDLFNITGQAKAEVRNELLFELMYSDQGATIFHWIGFGQVSRAYGQTGRHPSQLLADTYECIDGMRIDESPLYNPQNPSENRDPRFRSTLWMHGDTIEGNSSGTETGKIKFVLEAFDPTTRFFNYNTNEWQVAVNPDINSGAAWTSFANAGLGLMWRKFSNETVESINTQTCNVPLMRYAEILLTYAEAKIELGELEHTVYDAINLVRSRSGMPAVKDEQKGSQEKMRQLVRRERKVELIMEGLHFVDMRRWKIGDILNEGPSYGYPVALTRDNQGYMVTGGYEDMTPEMVPNFKKSQRHDLNDVASYDAYDSRLKVRDRNRFWNEKFNLLPIPQEEIDRNPNLIQNDGY